MPCAVSLCRQVAFQLYAAAFLAGSVLLVPFCQELAEVDFRLTRFRTTTASGGTQADKGLDSILRCDRFPHQKGLAVSRHSRR